MDSGVGEFEGGTHPVTIPPTQVVVRYEFDGADTYTQRVLVAGDDPFYINARFSNHYETGSFWKSYSLGTRTSRKKYYVKYRVFDDEACLIYPVSIPGCTGAISARVTNTTGTFMQIEQVAQTIQDGGFYSDPGIYVGSIAKPYVAMVQTLDAVTLPKILTKSCYDISATFMEQVRLEVICNH
jgi:hypothetical protein